MTTTVDHKSQDHEVRGTMSVDTEFSLKIAIDTVIRESDLLGPDAIADKVAENTPDEHLRAAYRTALRELVRIRLHRDRPPTAAVVRPVPVEPATLAALSATVTPLPAAAPRPAVVGVKNSARSPRMRISRELALQRVLNSQFHLGPNRWEKLGDFLLENVRFLEAERDLEVQRVAATRDMFARLGDAMVKHGVKRVRDLPESVLASILLNEVAA